MWKLCGKTQFRICALGVPHDLCIRWNYGIFCCEKVFSSTTDALRNLFQSVNYFYVLTFVWSGARNMPLKCSTFSVHPKFWNQPCKKNIPQKTLLIKKIYFNRLSFYFKFSLFDTYVYNPYKAGWQIPKFILIAYHKKNSCSKLILLQSLYCIGWNILLKGRLIHMIRLLSQCVNEFIYLFVYLFIYLFIYSFICLLLKVFLFFY